MKRQKKASKASKAKKAISEKLERVRHSAAHLLAQAVLERFSADGPVFLGGGPPVASGFYYDFGLPRPVESKDIEWLENRMKAEIKHGSMFRESSIEPSEARSLFKNQPFKLEMIDGILASDLDENGKKLIEGKHKLSIFRHGEFADLCAGPHVINASEIPLDGFKLDRIAGAYWKGSEENPMLVRIYGLCFLSGKELRSYQKKKEEAKKWDHRKLGKDLELFFFAEEAPGMPYWLPNGLVIYQELIHFWRKEHRKRGYQEISSPMLHHQKIWEISGHWEHYRGEMFLLPGDKKGNEPDAKQLGLKPMNCPDAMVVFKHRQRSYRELPLRLSDCDVLHRDERSGALHGLMRVRNFSQDDAHIFLAMEQVEQEIKSILEIVERFYSIFNLSYKFRVGLRPKKFVGSEEKWDLAERILIEILDKEVSKDLFEVVPGEGAFYGPKIDILIEDGFSREWQMGSIQLDFHLPERFECRYIDRSGKPKIPIVIHRVIYGSLERFIGILLEHLKGDLPLWLSPIQIAILPISEKHLDFCIQLHEKCIEKAELKKVPNILVIGDQEIDSGKMRIRKKGQVGKDLLSLAEILQSLGQQIENKKMFEKML